MSDFKLEGITVFWNNGKMFSVTNSQSEMFKFLIKLGLKGVPTYGRTTWTTYVPPGSYVVASSISHNTVTVTVNSSFSDSDFQITKIKTPSIDEPSDEKSCKPSKQKRREWRQQGHKHSRNTGLKVKLGKR